MINSDLRFRSTFNLRDNVLRVEDLTNYAAPPSGTAAVVRNNTSVYFRCAAPIGAYHDEFPGAGDIGNPDVLFYNGETEAQISLPLQGGVIPQGQYRNRMMTREWTMAVDAAIVRTEEATNLIVLDGDWTAVINPVIGHMFYIAGSATAANNKVYAVLGSVYNAGPDETEVEVVEDIEDAGASGIFRIFQGYNDYQTDIVANNVIFTPPSGNLEATVDCREAELTATDNTVYSATNDGSVLTPEDLTRQMVIVAPRNSDGSGYNPNTTTTPIQTITLSGIWSGMWMVSMGTEVVYRLQQDIYLLTMVYDTKYVDAQCVDCSCIYYQCIANMHSKLEVAKTRDLTRAATLRALLAEVTHTWMLLQMAERCGYDTSRYCDRIKELAASDDCLCDGSSSTISVPLSPWGGGGTGGTVVQIGTEWFNGSGVPVAELGKDDDYYLNDDNNDYYRKIGGVWILQGNLAGNSIEWHNGSGAPDPADHNVGDYYIDNDTKQYYQKTGVAAWTLLGYLTNYIKLHGDNVLSGSAAVAGNQTLKTFALPAGILDTIGDEIIVEAGLELRSGIPAGQTLSAGIFISILANDMTSRVWITPSQPEVVRLHAKFMVSAAAVISGYGEQKNITGGVATLTTGTIANIGLVLTNPHDIMVVVSSTNAALNDLVCNYFNVYIVKR